MIDVKLLFNLYSYEIEFGTKKAIIKKEYGHAPSSEKVEDAINLIAKSLLQFVKENHPN